MKLTGEPVFPTIAPNAAECVKLDGPASLLHFLYALRSTLCVGKRSHSPFVPCTELILHVTNSANEY